MSETTRVDEVDEVDVVATAASERRAAPRSESEIADRADKYDQMMRLASLFDTTGEDMLRRSRLSASVAGDPAFTDSGELAPATFAQASDALGAADTGKHSLLARSVELDADALVLRATVVTYRWIDDLQAAAFRTLGSIAGRAIGYLAPEVALGGAIVSAGLIETDALDRDGVAAYLNELAQANPDLMEHVTTGGGGLLDALPMRSLLTAGVLGGDHGRLARGGGLRAIGVPDFPTTFGAALRDGAAGLVDTSDPLPVDTTDEVHEGPRAAVASPDAAPANLAGLIARLAEVSAAVEIRQVAPSRYIAYIPGTPGQDDDPAAPGRLRLVGGDLSGMAAFVVRRIEDAIAGDDSARLMLVGSGHGGVIAAEVAATVTGDRIAIDQIVTAGAPSAQVPTIPGTTRVLSLEDRNDPVALLGSLINARVANRVTVVFDAAATTDGGDAYLAGARAADIADHPDLQTEIRRLQGLGYLAG
ncbi:MAG: hypothetical protein WB767_14725 [Nocardioides sp.]